MDPLNRRLEEIIEAGYTFHFGEYFERGVDLFRKNVAGFAGFTALFFLILLVLAIVPILGQLALLAVAPALMAGFYLVAHRIDQDDTVEFRDFFKGFDFLGQLMLVFLTMCFFIGLMAAPFLIALVRKIMAEPFAPPDLSGVVWYGWLLLLPMIYLVVAWRWAPLLVIFHRKNFWEALETSRRLINRQWSLVFLFSIATGLLGNLGYVVLLVGLFFTYPMALCIDYAAFADVTRLREVEKAEEDITDHLVE